MSYSTLYGVNSQNELIELQTYQNSHLACFPAWNYFEQKYFGALPSLTKPKCWDLEKKGYGCSFGIYGTTFYF